jgi:Ni/Co efflux regulator RcnB
MKLRIIAVVLAVAAVASMTLGGMHASAATVSRHPVTAAGRTCSAFRAWERHRTTASIGRMMADSVRAAWNPFGVDAVVLYTDVKSGENTAGDVKDMASACKGR